MPLILCYIVAKAETRRADSCLAKKSLDYITILVFTQNWGHTLWLFIALTISLFSKTPLRASLNVFLFFIGMTTCYHLYTIYFSGFNPMRYMMIWYGITFISPILAYICWYAKSTSKISIAISSLILYVMLSSSFGIGMWYIDLKNIIDTVIFIGTIIILYVNPKHTICSFIVALFLSFIVGDIFR